MRNKTRIAIIGANGYLARNLFHVLQNDYSGFELQLYGVEDDSIDHVPFYTRVDMTDRTSVSKIDFSCDIIFMMVGKTGSANGFDDYNSFIDINEKAMLNLLDEYRKQKSFARIVFPSTRLVYKGKKERQKEYSDKEFNTVYAVNKYACEQYLIQYHRVFDAQYTILRICVPYGSLIPGASSYGTAEFMIEKACRGENITLYGDGLVRRTLTHIKDLCVIMIEAAISDKCANDVFNIGGEEYSLKEMAELIAQKYSVNVDYVPWPDIALRIESGDTVFDSSKLDNVLGNFINHSFVDWLN